MFGVNSRLSERKSELKSNDGLEKKGSSSNNQEHSFELQSYDPELLYYREQIKVFMLKTFELGMTEWSDINEREIRCREVYNQFQKKMNEWEKSKPFYLSYKYPNFILSEIIPFIAERTNKKPTEIKKQFKDVIPERKDLVLGYETWIRKNNPELIERTSKHNLLQSKWRMAIGVSSLIFGCILGLTPVGIPLIGVGLLLIGSGANKYRNAKRNLKMIETSYSGDVSKEASQEEHDKPASIAESKKENSVSFRNKPTQRSQDRQHQIRASFAPEPDSRVSKFTIFKSRCGHPQVEEESSYSYYSSVSQRSKS